MWDFEKAEFLHFFSKIRFDYLSGDEKTETGGTGY